jgi:hypothetical protein
MVKFRKGFVLFLFVHFAFTLNASDPYKAQRIAVMKRAAANVGVLEEANNGGNLYNYYRESYYYKHSVKLPSTAATCGTALETWFLANGLNPGIEWAARAKNWRDKCRNFVVFSYKTTVSDLQAIPPASAIVYAVGNGFHVGLFVKAKGLGFYSIEANTSNKRSLVTYKQYAEGQFVCYTSLAGSKGFKPLGYCDVIPTATEFIFSDYLKELRTKYGIK